jgi:hypothetical protein
MRHALSIFSAAFLLLSSQRAEAQLEVVDEPAAAPVPASAGFDPSLVIHAGLRGAYTNLTATGSSYDAAFTIGPSWGVAFQHEAWRIFDMRLSLLNFGGAWSGEGGPDLVSPLGLHFGTGARWRSGIVSIAATAIAGLNGWLADQDLVTFELGGELSLVFHEGCEGVEIGYQALAAASDLGWAPEPVHAIYARWLVTSDGAEGRACRDGR